MSAEFRWNRRTCKVLVTGGAGFLGRAVVRELTRCGYERVYVPRSVDYDLTNLDSARRLFEHVTPELVVHLAAQVGGIEANRQHPGKFLYENLLMGTYVVELCRQFRVTKLLSAGTVCAYPKYAPVPFKENEIWNGYPEETNAPYGLAKKMLLEQSKAYRTEYSLDASVAFLANLYGPGDNFDLETSHVIPALVRKIDEAARRREPYVEVWGDGTPTREFLYVEDAAEALVTTAELETTPPAMNVGTGVETSIRDLAVTITRLVGYDGELRFNPSKPNGQPRRSLDVSQIYLKTGWRPRVDLETGLRRTIEWWRDSHGSFGRLV